MCASIATITRSHSYVRRELIVVADLDTVRVVDGTAVIVAHARCYSAGETIEAAHVEAHGPPVGHQDTSATRPEPLRPNDP